MSEPPIIDAVEIEARVLADESQKRSWLDSCVAMLSNPAMAKPHRNYAVQCAVDALMVAAAEKAERLLKG